MTDRRAGTSAPESCYSLTEIPGWETLALDALDRTRADETLERLALESIPEAVERQSATAFRLELHERLNRIVEDARSAGARRVCLPARRMGRTAVPASYTVSEWRDTEPDPAEPDDLLIALAANSPGSARLIELDGQVALREEEIDEEGIATSTVEGVARPARRVTYTVATPRDPRAWLLFDFTTVGNGAPTGPLADAQVRLFDAQLSTLRWVDVHPGNGRTSAAMLTTRGAGEDSSSSDDSQPQPRRRPRIADAR